VIFVCLCVGVRADVFAHGHVYTSRVSITVLLG
jgi:hypothetical protein